MRCYSLLLGFFVVLVGCGPSPTVVSAPPPLSFGEGGGGGGGREGDLPAVPLPVVPIAWEGEPLLVAGGLGERGVVSPMSLTSADGVGLLVSSLRVSAAVEDPLAFTEMHFVFRNPESRTLEGRFEIVLPPGATISRFAMKNVDGWKEGEVVEQQAARVAYEDFLHRRADPALLEKQAGNRFQARVFPIPALGEKEIVISYSQTLGSKDSPYRVFLRGLPRVSRFEMRVIERQRKSSPKAHVFQKADFLPDRDFVLPLAVRGTETPGLRNGELAVARVTPLAEARPEPVRDLLILVDTSASRALDLDKQAKRLGALLAALPDLPGEEIPIAVACFDQVLEPIYIGNKKGFGAKEIEAMLRRKALGASDLGLALESAAAFVRKQGGRLTRALLLTDGIPTAGPDDAGGIAGPLGKLRDAGIRRLDAIAAGGIRDEALLARLTRGIFPQGGVVLDAEQSPNELSLRLSRATVSGLAVTVPGAKWSYPDRLDSVQPGDEALVYAELPKGMPFEVEIAGAGSKVKRAVDFDFAERPLLERAMARAQIERLTKQRDEARNDAERTRLGREIVSISTRFRVLSDLTALLVLDTEEDYARFGIDRRALADILVVGPNGVDLMHRAGGPVAVAAATPDARGDLALPKPAESEGAEKKKDKGGEMAGGAVPATEAPPPPPSAPQALSREELREQAKAEPAPAPVSAPAATGTASGFGSGQGRAASAPRRANAPPSDPLAGAIARDEVAGPGSIEFRRDRDRAPERRPWNPEESEEDDGGDLEAEHVAPLEGKLAEVSQLLKAKNPSAALKIASDWRDSDPGDALALVALGDAFEALGDRSQAARAAGSLIDLFPGRADLRRFAGSRLGKIAQGSEPITWLVVDTFKKAVASRPDHPAGHRMLTYALLRSGHFEDAFEAILAGFVRPYPGGRFAGVRRVLADDVGIVAAVLIKERPERRAEVLRRLSELGLSLPKRPSLRFVLTWETDANDVDFHIRDGRKGHAFFRNPRLRSGGELYADVTTGYGPECFTIEGKPTAYPYRLRAHYYAKGPMGYGMGNLEIIEFDGVGAVKIEERPFVVMTDRAFVDLGSVTGPLKGN